MSNPSVMGGFYDIPFHLAGIMEGHHDVVAGVAADAAQQRSSLLQTTTP